MTTAKKSEPSIDKAAENDGKAKSTDESPDVPGPDGPNEGEGLDPVPGALPDGDVDPARLRDAMRGPSADDLNPAQAPVKD